MLFLLMLATSPALAASRQARENTARKACLSGSYDKGVSILLDLFVETKDPTYIFNQARCFEQNRRYEDAIARFQEYLRADRHMSVADKELAEKHIADCQVLADKEAARPHPAPVVAEPAPVVEDPPTATVPSAATLQAQPSSSTGSNGAGLRVAGIVTASVGVAAVVAGVVLNLKVNSMANDLESLGNYSDDKESDR